MYNNIGSKPYNKGISIKNKPEEGKLIQVPVILGYGEKQELVVSEITIAPPNPAVFRIVNIDKEVVITNFKLISLGDSEDGRSSCKAKVIIDGYVDKNILYKTIADFTDEAVAGPVYQYTTRIDFATFVEVHAKEAIFNTDNVEILSAFVEGEKDELLDPNDVAAGAPAFAITYNTLLEKMIVKINLKITRTEHICID